MNYYAFSSSCSMLAGATLANLRLKSEQQPHQSRTLEAIVTIGQSMLLGFVLTAAYQAFSNQISSTVKPVILLTGTIASIKAMTYAARETGNFAVEAENLDRHLKIFLDLAMRVSSITTLILLLPNAGQSPFGFALASASVALNIFRA